MKNHEIISQINKDHQDDLFQGNNFQSFVLYSYLFIIRGIRPKRKKYNGVPYEKNEIIWWVGSKEKKKFRKFHPLFHVMLCSDDDCLHFLFIY